MDDTTPVEMDSAAQDAFLGAGGTGVLSFATDESEPPHSVPVSYGYDDTEGIFYFRLAVGPESSKGDLVGRQVTFVTHDETADGWRSVIAQGTLESTADEETATDSLAGLERVDIPLVDVFEQPLRVVDFEFVRLVPDRQTGRAEADRER